MSDDLNDLCCGVAAIALLALSYYGIETYKVPWIFGWLVGLATFQCIYRGHHGRFFDPMCENGILTKSPDYGSRAPDQPRSTAEHPPPLPHPRHDPTPERRAEHPED